MGVLEDLRGLEARVLSRIRELEPAASELEELRAVAKRLGLDTTPPAKRTNGSRQTATRRRRRPRKAAAPKAGTTTAKRANGAKGAARKTRGSRGSSRRDQVLATIKRKPGLTVSELGKELKVDPTSLYRIIHQLEGERQVKKTGRTLQPVGS